MTAPRRRPSLDQLRTFVTVYRAGSFSAAARSLELSQPTITNHIGSLENWFGSPLFTRDVNGVTPTAYGHEVAVSVADQVDHIDRFFISDQQRTTVLREVRFGGPRELMIPVILPALAQDAGRLPKLQLRFDASTELLTDLRSGKLDLVVSTIRPRNPDVTAWPIADEEFWLVASPDLPIPKGSVSQLSTVPMVAFNRELAIIRRFWNAVFGAEPLFDADLVVPDLLAVKRAVLDGFGMSVLPSYLVAKEVADGRLVRLVEDREAPINTVFLVALTPALTARKTIGGMAALVRKRVKEHQQREAPS
ncbi:LysR family transcriptional regulator [Gordonia hydrophobica]|uniref:LysR family transcriptional regulator n=1 Tax=Gordonia hydrophobica TaxID=40516 RepID=A0ABZ2TWQ4_9ACTN|nr:LysR family transcriptional regulator [Gordonia hydrophobica]MBM7369313.1 DNA-binding transcriptional LysR family regulator [Gordonia hydrophobica]